MPKTTNRLLPRLSIVILVLVFIYFGFMFINNFALEEEAGQGIIIKKEYKSSKTSYKTQKVGKVVKSIPITIPEQYLITIKIQDQIVGFPVNSVLFKKIKADKLVQLKYKRKRLTKNIKIVKLSSLE